MTDGKQAPAGWYETGPGLLRWWDGARWTEHRAPVPDAAPATTPATRSSRPRGPAAWFGWAGLGVVSLLGLTSPGGSFLMAGLYVLAVATVGLVRGRVRWAGLRDRALAGVAAGVAVALLTVGGATAEPPPIAPDEPAPPAVAAPRAPAEPEPSASVEAAPESTATPPGRGTALAVVASLTVKGRAPRTGYDRAAFGQAWFDADRNGCDTRNDVLRRDLAAQDLKNSCKVLAGSLDPDPYTGRLVRFEVGGPSEVDVDHVVALGDAWQKGAGRWTFEKRLAFANDPVNLLAVEAGANRSKGDGDAATWLPPNRAFRCAYVARQVAVKTKYDLWVTAAERDAMTRVLTGCADREAVGPGPAPTEAAGPRPRATREPKPPSAPSADEGPVHYENCTAVRAAGASPIRAGQPGYSRQLDRDGDGVGCE